jgi:hypothetical protein
MGNCMVNSSIGIRFQFFASSIYMQQEMLAVARVLGAVVVEVVKVVSRELNKLTAQGRTVLYVSEV